MNLVKANEQNEIAIAKLEARYEAGDHSVADALQIAYDYQKDLRIALKDERVAQLRKSVCRNTLTLTQANID